MVVKLTLGALLLAAIVVTVVGYPKRYGALSARSRLFRFAGMGLVDLLLMVGLIYVSMPPLDGTRVTAFRHLSLMVVAVLLGLSLVCVALLDALESFVVLRREERAALMKIARDADRARRSDA